MSKFIEIHDGSLVKETELRVFRVLHHGADALTSDFTILGFRKESPSYEKGRKTSAKYFCPTSNDLIVEKIFEDQITDGNLTGINITFNFYNELNEIGASKTELAVEYNPAEAKTVLRLRRERVIDYLTGAAKDTPIESHVTAIFDHYYDQVLKFTTQGTFDLASAILSETDPTILAYLGIELDPVNLPGYTVKDSILAQVSE